MTNVENQTGITRASTLTEGFMGGCLVGLGLFSGAGALFQGIMLVAGIFVLLETTVPSHMDIHSLIIIMGAIFGVLVSVFSVILSASAYLGIVILCAAALIYLVRVLKHFGLVRL